MKNQVNLAVAATCLVMLPMISHAQNPILSSLKAQGVQTIEMDDRDLNKIRGAAFISGQPLPSVILGLKTYNVTWKKFGSQSDYRSYSFMGSSYNPHGAYHYRHEGTTYRVAGDVWLADNISNVGTWNAAYASQVDMHVKILDPVSLTPSNYGFRTSSWNRPISTFSW